MFETDVIRTVFENRKFAEALIRTRFLEAIRAQTDMAHVVQALRMNFSDSFSLPYDIFSGSGKDGRNEASGTIIRDLARGPGILFTGSQKSKFRYWFIDRFGGEKRIEVLMWICGQVSPIKPVLADQFPQEWKVGWRRNGHSVGELVKEFEGSVFRYVIAPYDSQMYGAYTCEERYIDEFAQRLKELGLMHKVIEQKLRG